MEFSSSSSDARSIWALSGEGGRIEHCIVRCYTGWQYDWLVHASILDRQAVFMSTTYGVWRTTTSRTCIVCSAVTNE